MGSPKISSEANPFRGGKPSKDLMNWLTPFVKWGQDIPKPQAQPQQDQVKTMLDALNYADTQKKIRQSSGRAGTFLTAPRTFTF